MIRTIHQNIVSNLLSQGKSHEEIKDLPIIKNQLLQEEITQLITQCSKEIKPSPKKELNKYPNPITFRPTKKVKEELNKIKNKSNFINKLLIKHFKKQNDN